MNNAVKILPVVVVFNVDYHECNVFRSLLSHWSTVDVVLYDNSPEPINRQYESGTLHYISDPSNGGVSAAYNVGASIADDIGATHLLLLDHDTTFEPDYIGKLTEAIRQYPEERLFVPQVILADGTPFSPFIVGRFGSKGIIANEGTNRLGKMLPVNSGACVELTAFNEVEGYNPKIRLDFADFDFFGRLAERHSSFIVVGSTARQSFSNEETDVSRLLSRYRFYLEGAKAAQLDSRLKWHILRHTIALTMRTRSLEFLKLYINNK